MYIYIIYIYIYLFHKYDSLFRSSPPWNFLCKSVLEIRGELAGVGSVPKSDFNRVAVYRFVRVTLRRGSSVNLLHIFQGTSLWEHLNLSFEKALLSLIVYFKGILTYCYHSFVHDSQIFNILQLLLIMCNSSVIYMSCVCILKLCCLFSIIEYFSNKFRFNHLKKATLKSDFNNYCSNGSYYFFNKQSPKNALLKDELQNLAESS